jgi:hypothetical protein
VIEVNGREIPTRAVFTRSERLKDARELKRYEHLSPMLKRQTVDLIAEETRMAH